MFRVAALQFASNDDVDQNLATCLRMIDAAAETYQAELMVLPEFCNHISWYDDHEHARRVAVTLDGSFLSAVAARAARHQALIVINCSLRREADKLTVTSLLYGPDGQLWAQADKQTLMGHENVWFARAGKSRVRRGCEQGRAARPCPPARERVRGHLHSSALSRGGG
jgi:predicted amidohydrolase